MTKENNVQFNKDDAMKVLTEAEASILDILVSKIQQCSKEKQFLINRAEGHIGYIMVNTLGINAAEALNLAPKMAKEIVEEANGKSIKISAEDILERIQKTAVKDFEDFIQNVFPNVQMIKVSELNLDELHGLPTFEGFKVAQDIAINQMVPPSFGSMIFGEVAQGTTESLYDIIKRLEDQHK